MQVCVLGGSGLNSASSQSVFVPPLKLYFIYGVPLQLMMAGLLRCHIVGDVGRLEVLLLFLLYYFPFLEQCTAGSGDSPGCTVTCRHCWLRHGLCCRAQLQGLSQHRCRHSSSRYHSGCAEGTGTSGAGSQGWRRRGSDPAPLTVPSLGWAGQWEQPVQPGFTPGVPVTTSGHTKEERWLWPEVLCVP